MSPQASDHQVIRNIGEDDISLVFHEKMRFEQAQNQKPDARSDIYSIGYEPLTYDLAI